MSSRNPYGPPIDTCEQSGAPLTSFFSLRVLAAFDVIGGLVLMYFANYAFRTSADAVTDAFAVLCAVASVTSFGTSVGLLMMKPWGWWLAVIYHCLACVSVLAVYGGLLWLMITTWGETFRGSAAGGTPVLLAIVTIVFLLAEATAAVPLVILGRSSTRQGFSSQVTGEH